MKEIKKITEEEKKQMMDFLGRYYTSYFLTGSLKTGIPCTFVGGEDINFKDVAASIIFAMKRDKRVENIIRGSLSCFNDTPSLEDFKKSRIGKKE